MGIRELNRLIQFQLQLQVATSCFHRLKTVGGKVSFANTNGYQLDKIGDEACSRVGKEMNSSLPRSILSTVSPYSLAFKRQKLPLSTKLSRPISFPSISSIPTSQKSQIPLFLRPPTFTASASDLQKWQQWAKNLALSVGSKFVDSDNGPDTNILCREVKWLLEDAVEDKSILPQLVSAENGKLVRLRADLDELYRIWKQRIEERRPLQYIVGCEHWRDLVLSVQEGVLIPRPETELIVDLVSELVLEEEGLGEGIWADLGTGSGAIAIGLARILGGGGKVIATDLSPIAVSVAEFNVKRYDLQTNGEKQSKFLLDFMTNKSVTNVQNVKVISDFSGIERFVTGFRQ
ncbi:uncharacterized protein LOC122069503 isoform X2 [Macadamia integrifolia]|uniref:uncharacterized protein LOC122069503 isoform X2 n=1 Tax=Macadamia integrifolia TaxID=60698 RepID=UPI001C4E963E|nr:uncharacterized protein LOC122069503 isoform X2 [Macadamia integrifolia]